jgi:hypothetical protein
MYPSKAGMILGRGILSVVVVDEGEDISSCLAAAAARVLACRVLIQ